MNREIDVVFKIEFEKNLLISAERGNLIAHLPYRSKAYI